MPGLAKRSAGIRVARRRPRGPASAARAHRRAHRRLPGDRPRGRRARAGVRGDDVGHRGGQPRPRGGGGQLRAGAAHRAERQPARTSCSAPAPIRRSSSWATSAPRCATTSASASPRTGPIRWMRSTHSGARRRAESWWPPPDLARPTPGRCSSTSRCVSLWCPMSRTTWAPASLLPGRPSRRQAVDVHAAGHLRSAARYRPDTRHRRHRRARRRCAPQSGRICRPSRSRPRRPPQNPLHPFALRLVRPQQVIMLGRPTLHRPVSALLADPAVPVYALTTGPRWPDVSGNSAATGTRAVTTGEPDPAWLERCAEVNRHAVDAVRAQLEAHPLKTGLHVAAAVADARAAGRSVGARRIQPGPGRGAGRPEHPGHQGAVEPRRRRHRRHGVDGDRRGACPRPGGGGSGPAAPSR